MGKIFGNFDRQGGELKKNLGRVGSFKGGGRAIFPQEAGGGTNDEAAKNFFFNKIHLISFLKLKLSKISLHSKFE